jgi:hypothetical protein
MSRDQWDGMMTHMTDLSLCGSNNTPQVGQGCKPFFLIIKVSKHAAHTKESEGKEEK